MEMNEQEFGLSNHVAILFLEKYAKNGMSRKLQELSVVSNFQLHAPINENTNIFRNQCGSLYYPLLFEATWVENTYIVDYYEPRTITSGFCQYI